MSIENARAFHQKVMGDRVLQQKIMESIQNNQAEMGELVVKIAAEEGFEFSIAEMQSFGQELAANLSKGGELSDVELEMVAGGSKTFTGGGDGGQHNQTNWIVASVCSLGIACASTALFNAIGAGCDIDGRNNIPGIN